MNESPFYKAPYFLQGEELTLVDILVYAVLVRHANSEGKSCYPSLNTIIDYCSYQETDKNGNKVFLPDGTAKMIRLKIDALHGSFERLKRAHKILSITYVPGSSNQYEILIPSNYSKIHDSFLRLDLPPFVKGYLIGFLQFSMEKDTGLAKCWLSNEELAEYLHTSPKTISKAQMILKQEGYLTMKKTNFIETDGSFLVKWEKTIDLKKLQIDDLYVKLEQIEKQSGKTARDVDVLKHQMNSVIKFLTQYGLTD